MKHIDVCSKSEEVLETIGKRNADKEVVQSSSLLISVFSEFFSASHTNDNAI